jgi:thiamine-phosphate pyrophosphorylase
MISIIATNPYSVVYEIESITLFFEHGLDCLYINKPNMTSKELDLFIQEIPSKYHSKLIISKDIKVADKYKVFGIILDPSWYKALFFNWFTLSSFIKKNPSIKRITQIKSLNELKHLDFNIDIAIIYPVFAENYIDNILNLKEEKALDKSKAGQKIELMAMGGVDESRIESIYKFKFDGFILQSSIWRSSEPLEAFKKAKERSEENKNK